MNAAYRQPFTQAVVEDFERAHPRVVLVDRRLMRGMPPNWDILSFFLADPRFAAQWSQYHQVATVTAYSLDVYRRNQPDGLAARTASVRASSAP